MSLLFHADKIEKKCGNYVRIFRETENIFMGSREVMTHDYEMPDFAVYIQIVKDSNGNIVKAYVGKTASTANRTRQHDRTDDYDWDDLIVMFVQDISGDYAYFRESDISYVEAKLINDLLDNHYPSSINKKRETVHTPPPQKGEKLYKFAKEVLPILGIHLFDPPIKGCSSSETTDVISVEKSECVDKIDFSSVYDIVFTFTNGKRGANASGRLCADGKHFTILKGSQVSLYPPRKCEDIYEGQLKKLIDSGVIDSTSLKYLIDYTHSSLNNASCILNRGNIQAPEKWFFEGKSIREVMKQFDLI